MYLFSFTTGGVKIAQQENDGHCAGKRFFPMLRFSMHKQRKKSIFCFLLLFFFFYYYFFKAEISCPLTLRTKRIQSITIYLKKEKKCLYIMYSQQTTFVIKKEKTRNQVAYSSTLFSLVYLHSTRGLGGLL